MEHSYIYICFLQNIVSFLFQSYVLISTIKLCFLFCILIKFIQEKKLNLISCPQIGLIKKQVQLTLVVLMPIYSFY